MARRAEPLKPPKAAPRPERQAAWLERQIGAQALFARTGLRPEPKYSLPKLLWIREHRAADFTRLRRWAGVSELAALTLTGKLATNASLACRTMMFDVSVRAWDAELLGLASLEPENMPEVLPLGQAAGGLTEPAANRLGLPTNRIVSSTALLFAWKSASRVRSQPMKRPFSATLPPVDTGPELEIAAVGVDTLEPFTQTHSPARWRTVSVGKF